MITTKRVTSAMLALALSLPAAAWAADAPAAAQAAGSRQDRVEQRIADMHATLRITKAEEPQFDAFSQVMLDNAQGMDGLLTANSAKAATQTAPEMMQSYAQVARQHADDVQKLSAAFESLYAALTPDQKKSADDMFRSAMLQREQAHDAKTGG
jgi:ribosome-binding ATPase YchF (GTP1/OBG family)